MSGALAVAASVASGAVPTFLFTGESNSGGRGSNSSLTAEEAAARPQVQILNNTSLIFENLLIGTNNRIGHAGLTDNAEHGWENELANAVALGRFAKSSVYLVKTGQGGSVITDWAVGGAYDNTRLARISAATSLLSAVGRTPFWVVFYSLGINDAIAGTNVSTWKAAVVADLAHIRATLGPTTPVCMTKFQSPMTERATFNTAIDEIAAADPYTRAISTTDAAVNGDNIHWSYSGLKVVAERLIDGVFYAASYATSPTSNPATDVTYTDSVLVSLAAPLAKQIRYSIDGTAPESGSIYSAPFILTNSATVKSLALEKSKKMSGVLASSYSVTPSFTFDPSGKGTLATLSSGNSIVTGAASASWTAARSTIGKSSGKWYSELKIIDVGTGVSPGANDIFALICDATTAGGTGMNAVGFANSAGPRGNTYSGWVSGTFVFALTSGLKDLAGLQNNDIVGIAFDSDGHKCWFSYNNSWVGGGVPSTGTTPYLTWSTAYTIYPAVGLNNSASVQIKGRSADLVYTPPSGFSAYA